MAFTISKDSLGRTLFTDGNNIRLMIDKRFIGNQTEVWFAIDLTDEENKKNVLHVFNDKTEDVEPMDYRSLQEAMDMAFCVSSDDLPGLLREIAKVIEGAQL